MEQAEVEAECQTLYAQYKEEAWIRPFNKNFVSFFFLLTTLFVLAALFRAPFLRARWSLWIWRWRR